jgi:hypothetical protein
VGPDFVALNVLGNGGMAAYVALRRHSLALNDLIFGVHSFAASVVMAWAAWAWDWHRWDARLVRRYVVAFAVCLPLVLWLAVSAHFCTLEESTGAIAALGMLKTATSVPRGYLLTAHNVERQSTVGLSTMALWLDFIGCLCSLGQQWVDEDLGRPIADDPVKFSLALVSLSFAIIFLVQHHIIYRGARRRSDIEIEAVQVLSAKETGHLRAD